MPRCAGVLLGLLLGASAAAWTTLAYLAWHGRRFGGRMWETVIWFNARHEGMTELVMFAALAVLSVLGAAWVLLTTDWLEERD